MYIGTVFCAMRDQDVFVALPDDASEEMKAELENTAIICGKYSWAPICTGQFCPHFAEGRVGIGMRPQLTGMFEGVSCL